MHRRLILLLLIALPFAGHAGDDEAAVHAVFHAYRTAALDQDGAQAACHVTEGTRREYERHRDLALAAPREVLRQLAPTERVQVLMIRQRIPPAQLRRMDGGQLLAHAVDRGWIGRDGVQRADIGAATVVGDVATAPVRLDGEDVPFRFEFLRQSGQWRLNLLPLLKIGETYFRQLATQYGGDGDRMVMAVLAMAGATPVDESIWEPPGR